MGVVGEAEFTEEDKEHQRGRGAASVAANAAPAKTQTRVHTLLTLGGGGVHNGSDSGEGGPLLGPTYLTSGRLCSAAWGT